MVFRIASKIYRIVEKEKAEGRAKIAVIEQFPLIEIKLKSELSLLKRFDFKDFPYQQINFKKWFNKFHFVNLKNENEFYNLHWYDLGLFKFALLPLTMKVYNDYIFIRVLTIGDSLTPPMSLDVHSSNELAFWPDKSTSNVNCTLSLAPDKLVINDLKIRVLPSNFNSFTIMFSDGSKQLITCRLLIFHDGRGKLLYNYYDIYESRFYNLVDLPYITPIGSQDMVCMINNLRSPKSDFMVERELNLDQYKDYGRKNGTWVAHYISLTEYWG